jgi:hypothetical protein
MHRIELWLLGIVGALILFVATQAFRGPQARPALVVVQQGQEKPAGAPLVLVDVPDKEDERITSAALQTSSDMNGTVRRSNSAAPLRNLVDVRNRVRDGAQGTYILDMLLNQDSTLFRWPNRPIEALHVWVQTDPHDIPDWWVGYAQVARDVFSEWEGSGFPMNFQYAPDSVGTDITVRWVDRFPAELDRRIGSTRRMSDQHAWIVNAQITVALHDSRGRKFGPNELAGILRHEIGHALGLGHSRNQSTIMFPEEATIEIAEADRATMRLLYSLPPGSLR